MIAIREIVNRDIFTGFDVPKEFGDEFEMILIPIKKQDIHYTNDRSNDIFDSQPGDIRDEKVENEQFLLATYNNIIEDNKKEDKIWSKYL